MMRYYGLHPPDVWVFIYKKQGRKKTRLSPGWYYRDIISTSSTYNTGQTAKATRKIFRFSFMVFLRFGSRAFARSPLVYLVLIIATPIRGSSCFRRMKSKALFLVVVWNSYHCEPYLYLTTKVLRLISFIVFSRGSG